MLIPPRFDATRFSAVTPAMQASFARDGVLVLDNMISHEDCDALKSRMDTLALSFDYEAHRTVFSTTAQSHANDEYFLSSGSETRFFFEDGAFDETGTLQVEAKRALNKVGHALHDTDPVFSRVSRQTRFEILARGLGLVRPLLLQSMYIFKQPHIGGEVICHQDATFLWTEPQSVLGIWLALEDATISNGCLWGIPGGHKGDAPKSRFRRRADGTTTETITLDETPFDEQNKVPLEAPKGTVLAFGGLFPHLSGANRSPKSRHAYTLHVIDGEAHYSADNWLQRPADMPLRGFDRAEELSGA